MSAERLIRSPDIALPEQVVNDLSRMGGFMARNSQKGAPSQIIHLGKRYGETPDKITHRGLQEGSVDSVVSPVRAALEAETVDHRGLQVTNIPITREFIDGIIMRRITPFLTVVAKQEGCSGERIMIRVAGLMGELKGKLEILAADGVVGDRFSRDTSRCTAFPYGHWRYIWTWKWRKKGTGPCSGNGP